MKNLLTICFTATFGAFFAQSEVSIWQQDHPEITFLEQTDFNQLTAEQQSLIAKKTIVYYQEIQVSDILAFENEKQSKHPNAIFSYADTNAQEIKNWLGLNQDIITVNQVEFESLPLGKQTELLEAEALVYSGDFLTLIDITSYEESH